MILKLGLELPEEESHVAIVRHMSRSFLECLNVTRQDIDDFEVVVGELATNVVRHSGDAKYRVEWELHHDRAVVTVIDRGRGFLLADVPPPGTPRPDGQGEPRIGGLGLPMVELLADHVQFFPTEPQGTTVRAEKRLRFRSPATVPPS